MDWDKVKKQRSAEAKVKMPDTSNSNPKITDDDVNGFLNSIDSATKDVEKYLTEPTYSTRDERSGYRSTIRNQRNKANEIALYVAQNRNKYSNSDEILNYLDNYIESLGGLAAGVSKYGDFYSSNFKSEDDYNNYLDSIKKQEEILNFDTAAANKELSDLEAARNNIEYDVAYDTARSSRFGVSARKNIGVDQTERENLDRRISELKQKITLASRAQNAEKLRSNALNDIEFKKYSDQGASIKNPSMRDAEGFMTVFGKPIGGEDIGNIVTYSRDNWKEIAMGGANGGTVQGNAIYKYMTGEEVDIYNYYLAKEGAEKASEYLDSITENLNMRQASGIYDELEDKTALQYVFGVSAGLDQFGSGVRNTIKAIKGDDSYTPASSTQIASGMIREGLADDGAKLPEWMGGGSVGQLGYDAITNTTNNLPSMLVGSIFGPGAGAITMGASVYGNAYSEMINLGYDKSQANTYAALSAASETGLQYLLGGISSLGGKVSNNVLKRIISNVDNAFAKIAIQYGGEMMSEFTEEYLQDVLDPYFKNLATGENNEVTLLSPDAMYSGILGALNAGASNVTFGAINNVANNSYLNNYYKETYGEGVDSLIQEGLATEKDSKSYSLAEKLKAKTESGEDISGAAIRKLVEANEKQFNNADTAKIESAAEQRLKSLGETGDSAKIAKALTKQVKGEVLSISEQKALDNSKYGQRVANELSPENIRSGNYSSSWAENIGTDRINADLYNLAQEAAGVTKQEAPRSPAQIVQNVPQTKQESAGAKVQTSETNSLPKAKNAVQSEFKVSDNGKTFSLETGEDIKIADIASIKNGKMTFKLENGEEIGADKVSFGNNGEALIYETVANLPNMNAASANLLIKNMDLGTTPADVYARGIEEAYRYGTYNIPAQEMMENGAFAADLTKRQRMQAYRLGRSNHKAATRAKEATVRKNRTIANKKEAVAGKVHYDKTRAYNDRQKASIAAIEKIAEALGVDFYLFESKEINGKRRGANGWYDPKDGSIHIDIYAGQNGESTMLFTAAHELTHFIKDWSPAKFDILADFLMEEYGKKGVSVNALVRAQQEKARRNGREISYDVAYEEVIADSMETMLVDGNVMEKLAQLKAKDKTLWEKIKSFIDELVNKIREVYFGLTPNSEEGQYVAEMKDSIEKIQQLFTEGVIEAAENFQTIGSIDLENFADAKNTDGEQLFQYRAMETDEETYKSMLKKWGKFSDAQINNLFTTIDKAMDIIKDNLEILDYAWEADVNDRAFSPVKPNSDSLYQVSIDFSTLCRKRLLQQTVQAQLQEALNRPMTREEGIAIRDALMAIQKEGRQIEIACALCYVESARMKSPAQIKKFLENREAVLKDFFASKSGGDMKAKIKEAELEARERLGVGDAFLKSLSDEVAEEIRAAKREAKASYKPTAEEQKLIDAAMKMTVSDFTTPAGLENLAKNYRGIFDGYTSYVRNATKSKGIENDTWWRAGDSASIGDTLIANMNRENGLRSQSWSDFQVIHMMDYIAAVIELSTRNSKMQAYTKVPDYVELMGKTGAMINLSLIPTRNYLGFLDYDSTEGMDYRKSLELRSKYHETVGTICIGVDNRQIKQLLEDMTIDYVIPYHKSGMASHIRKAMHIPTWTQYENYQNEKKLSDVEARKNADKYGVKLLDKSDANYQKQTSFSEWFDLKEAQQIAKMENARPSDPVKQKKYGVMYGGYMAMQNAANNYLKLCAERGLAPVFSHKKADFTGEDNYWKVLIDRKMVDNITGEVIEQKAIQPIFDEAEVLRILNDELERYPKVKADQEYAIRRVTEKFLSGDIKEGMSSDAIAKAMQKPVDNISNTNIVEAAKEMDEVKRSDRDSDGRELSEEQTKFFKNSVVRDAEGRLLPMYHGTANGGAFTIFEGDKLSNKTLTSQIGQGFYFTNVKDEAKAYMRNRDIYGKESKGRNPYLHEVYLNITNPLNVNDDIDLDAAKAVFRDGDYDWFFDSGIPFELNNRTVNGVKLTKTEVQNMSKEEKASLYVDYLFQVGGTKEVLQNMPKAFYYDKQGGLLEAMKKNLGHDGIVDEFKPGKFQYVAFSSEQIKQVDNKTPTTDPDIRYSDRDYSYDALVSKPDMKVTDVGGEIPTNRADVVAQAKKNAAKIGKFNSKDGNVSVYVNDIDTDVVLGTPVLKHGLDRRFNENAAVTLKAGEIIQNSIRINELTPQKEEAKASYVLIGAAKNENGDLYIVRSVVNRFSNELASMDVLYAINAKKENRLRSMRPGFQRPVTDSAISIANLLDYVNKYFPDILPEEVLKHYGHTSRPKGKIGESALFQDRIDIADRNRAVILQNKAERLEKELADLERAYKKAQDYARAEGVLAGQIEQGAQMAKELRQKQESFNRKVEGYEKTISDKRNQIAEIRAKRDELLAKAKAEKTEAVAKARQKAAETQREIITRYQESRKKAVEGRHQTEMRHKIKGVVNELNQLLIHGTKDRHVMIGLQKAVAEALDAVNMDTIGADERVAKYDALIAKASDPDVIASLTATRDRIRRQGDNLSEKIAQLKAAYGDIKNSDDPLVANGYDEVIASKIDSVVSTVGNTPLRAMSTKQLEDVYDMYRMVLTRIRGANESFKSAKKEAISVLGNRVMMEVEHVGGKHPYRLKGSEKIEGFMWNNLKPVYAFEKIGSKTLTEVYNNVRAGEDTFARDVTEAREFFVKENRKYHYDKWNMEKGYTFKSKTGQSFKLTIPQIMSLYAYSKRNQADKHLELGGFVFDSNIEVTQKKKGIPVKYAVNTATAYNISKETLGDIIGKLTAEQKAFVDEMQDFLSSTMGEKGNEVSLAMYGVKLFKEKHYFPLKSAKQFMFEQNETAGEVKLKNSGFSKETVVNASNPIILSNFMDVWANHVNDMSMYHSFVLPLEDFNRVFNYKTPNSESLDTESVKQFIQNAYGKEANAYIKQLLTDLNGGAVSDPRETTAKRLISNFKKAAVFSSASVVIQQPSAIGRALAIIDPKYFVGGKIGAKGHNALWAEVKKYAPVAIIKEMGYFDTNMGRSTVDFITAKEYKGFTEKTKGLVIDSGYRDEILSKAPALADEITWCAIWNAVKRETKATHKELTPGSEEFLKAAGARFTEVITKTQVYDSILSRSANMRSKSTFMSMWTSFMGEPTTSINMIEDAIRQGKRGNKKYAAKAIGSVFTSMVLNSLLVSLVYAARDDDEDETYLEKYLASLTSEVIEGINPLTYLPFFKDVWSSLQGFDIERADMSLITKLIESTQKAYKVYTEDTEDMSEEELLEHDKKVAEANWSIVDGISSLIGLPVKNLRRDINGAINLVRTVEKDLGGRKTTKGSLADKIEEAVRNSVPILGWGKGESRGDRLYDAIIAGDETYVNRIKDSIGDDQKYANMRFATLRDNDPRIKEAAQTAFGGDYAGAKKIAEAIIAEGNFSRNEVFSVISTELTKLKNAGKENSYEEKDKLLFGANDFFNAAKNNNVKDANAIRDELIAKKQDEGYLKWEAINSVESSFASEVKKSYIDGDITAQKAKDILMKYGGKESVSEAETEIKKWNFELKQGYTWSARARGYRLGDISKQELISAVMDIEGDDEEGAELYIRFLDLAKNNEDIEITSYDASSYFKYAEPAGIEVATYLDYKDEASKCKGEKDEYGNTIRNTKKAQILLVIDALPITNEQKDALYFANGWAQSTLKDAPWH